MSIMCFVGLDMLMGLDTPKLIVPTEFKVFDFSLNLLNICLNMCVFLTYDCLCMCVPVSVCMPASVLLLTFE